MRGAEKKEKEKKREYKNPVHQVRSAASPIHSIPHYPISQPEEVTRPRT